MFLERGGVEHVAVGVVYLANRPAWGKCFGHGFEPFAHCREDMALIVGGLTHDQCAHHGSVVAAEDASPLQI